MQVTIYVHPEINRLDGDAGNNRSKIRATTPALFTRLKEALRLSCPQFIESYARLRLQFLSETEGVVSLGTPLFSIECAMQESLARRVARPVMEAALQHAVCAFLKKLDIDGPVESTVKFYI